MAFLKLISKRLVAQRLLTLAVVVTMAFAIGVVVAGPVYTAGSERAILTGQLAQSDVSLKNLRLSAYSGPGFVEAAADREVRKIAQGLPSTGVLRQGESTQFIFTGEKGTNQTFLGFRDDAFRHLGYTGRAPVAVDQIAIPQELASTLGGIGSKVTLATGEHGARAVTLEVTALYRPPKDDEQFWFGDGTIFPQPGNPASPPTLPILTTASGFGWITQRLGVVAGQIHDWDVYLDLNGLSLSQIQALLPAIHASAGQLAGVPGVENVNAQTGLDTLTQLVAQQVGQAKAPIYLVVFQIAAVALAVLAGVASLALSNQSFELAVLKSRGFSRRQLLYAQFVQAGLSAVVALPLGLALGLVLARFGRSSHGPYVPGSSFPIDLGAAGVIAGVVAALVAVGLVVLVSLPHVSRTVIEERREASREGRSFLTRFPVELVIGPIGIFAYLEARSRGLGANVTTGSIDPLLLLAPTLLLFAASFAFLRLMAWGLRGADGLIGRIRRVAAFLAGRRLGRSAAMSFATALLLVLITGLLAISSSYRATILRSHQDQARQQLGADWQVQTDTQYQALAAMRRLTGPTTPIYSGAVDMTGGFGGSNAVVIGIDPATYQRGGWWRSDYANQPLPDLLAELRQPPAGYALPAGATELTARVLTPSSMPAGYRLVAMVERPDGTVVRGMDSTLRHGTATYRGTLTEGDRLLSLVIERPGLKIPPRSVSLTVDSLAAGGTPIDLSGWVPLRWLSSDAKITPAGPGGGIHLLIATGTGDSVGGVAPPTTPIPVLASSSVVSASGSTFDGLISGVQLRFTVVGTPSGFPSSPTNQPFVVLPEASLYEALLRVPEPSDGMNQVWAMGPDNPAPSIARAGITVDNVQSAARLEQAMSLNAQSLAIGMHFTASAGGMALVVIGVAASIFFGQRRRRFEFAALRALGTRRAQMIAALALEQAAMILIALGAAAALSYGLLRLMMPSLGPSITSTFPQPVLVFDWQALLAFAIAVGAAATISLVFSARALLAASVTSVLRGEVE